MTLSTRIGVMDDGRIVQVGANRRGDLRAPGLPASWPISVGSVNLFRGAHQRRRERTGWEIDSH